MYQTYTMDSWNNSLYFFYQVIEIKNKNEFIIHRYWYNILSEILYFLLLPMKVKYISL